MLTPRGARPPGPPSRHSASAVSQSIAFVNYLSDWAATLVLAQHKARNRVRLLEKLVGVAICLRELECFDALMGVLAGLNSQPVFRLAATWAPLKERPIYKRFRSLNRLMASNKGFAAYRLALANSRPDRLPYLCVRAPQCAVCTRSSCTHSGCHLQDITRVCESKSDHRNGLVNWSKMNQLAEHANVVSNCATLAPRLPNVPEAERLITGVPVLSLEDDVRGVPRSMLCLNAKDARTVALRAVVQHRASTRAQARHGQAARPL